VSKCGNAEGCGLQLRVSFLTPRMVDGEQPCSGKIECKEIDPPVKTAELYTFHLITPEPE